MERLGVNVFANNFTCFVLEPKPRPQTPESDDDKQDSATSESDFTEEDDAGKAKPIVEGLEEEEVAEEERVENASKKSDQDGDRTDISSSKGWLLVMEVQKGMMKL